MLSILKNKQANSRFNQKKFSPLNISNILEPSLSNLKPLLNLTKEDGESGSRKAMITTQRPSGTSMPHSSDTTLSGEDLALDVMFGHHEEDPQMEIHSVYAVGESDGEGANYPDQDFSFAAK